MLDAVRLCVRDDRSDDMTTEGQRLGVKPLLLRLQRQSDEGVVRFGLVGSDATIAMQIDWSGEWWCLHAFPWMR